MLTLTRKAGQKIRIGDDIEIVVREIRGRQVRLGISAPEGLTVYREELYQQILAEGEDPAAEGKAPGLTRRVRARGEADEAIVEIELPDDASDH
ncbi:carbon storage regulator CsrA [Nannocystaceae bacterium ST9]